MKRVDGVGPGQADAPHPVLGALDPWRPGVHVGEELARIEVTPLALLAMVVGGEHPLTRRTGPPGPSRVVHPDVDPSAFSGQLDPIHLPRGLETQHLPVELGIADDGILPPKDAQVTWLPTENPEAPKNPTTSTSGLRCSWFSRPFRTSNRARHPP